MKVLIADDDRVLTHLRRSSRAGQIPVVVASLSIRFPDGRLFTPETTGH